MESIKIYSPSPIKVHINAPFEVEFEIFLENPGSLYTVSFEIMAVPLFFRENLSQRSKRLVKTFTNDGAGFPQFHTLNFQIEGENLHFPLRTHMVVCTPHALAHCKLDIYGSQA